MISRRSRGFTLVELLVVIAIIAIIAGLVVPSLMNAQSKAYEAKCMSNLKGIHNTAFLYAQGTTKAFPIANMKDPPAHESLNVLIKSRHGESLEPDHFICVEGEAVTAQSDPSATEGPRFLLMEHNLSYAWVRRRTTTTDKGPLSSDKYYAGYTDQNGPHKGHKGALIVIDTNGGSTTLELDQAGQPAPGSRYQLQDGLPIGLTR